VLLGRLPGEPLAAEFHFADLQLPARLPLTLLSTLPDRRPDVLAAEAQLRAASAQVGVAAADRLPTILLGVNAWGSSAYRLADLFMAGSGFWTLAGSVSQTLFEAGQLQHREAQARALYEESVAQYRLAVLTAYQGVADVLHAIDADARGLQAAERARRAAESTLAITRRQLELGDVNSIAVVLAEENALQASLTVAQARANRLSDAVALVQALGGGWWNRDEDIAATPAK